MRYFKYFSSTMSTPLYWNWHVPPKFPEVSNGHTPNISLREKVCDYPL